MATAQLCRDLRARGLGVRSCCSRRRIRSKDKVTGWTAALDDYLTKPFDFGELLARGARVGTPSLDPLLQELSIADLKIDPVTRKVTRAAQIDSVDAKEYQLLEC